MTQQDISVSISETRGAVRPHRRYGRRRCPALAAAMAALSLGAVLGACGDDLLEPQWGTGLDTVQLFSLARPQLNLPSAFDFTLRRTYRIEAPGATGHWDVALDTEGGELVFVPPTVLGITSSRARISPRPSSVDFDEVTEAPTDTTEYTAEAVPAEIGRVYVVRTNETVTAVGRRCVYFAKMEPLEMDPEVGTLTFLYEANPLCNDRGLVPTVETDGG